MNRVIAVLLLLTALVWTATLTVAVRTRRVAAALASIDSEATGSDTARIDALIATAEDAVAALRRRPADDDRGGARADIYAVADEAAIAARRAGSLVSDIVLSPVDGRVSLSGSGSPASVVAWLAAIDAALRSHRGGIDDFSITAGSGSEVRVGLSLDLSGRLETPPALRTERPRAGSVTVAASLATRGATTATTAAESTGAAGARPRGDSAAVRWLGTVGMADDVRYVIRLDPENLVVVIGSGDPPVFGWRVTEVGESRIRVEKEGSIHEVSLR